MMPPGSRGALDIGRWRGCREPRQIVCAHSGSSLKTGGETDQSRLAKRRPAGI